MIADVLLALAGALLFLIGAAGVDVERRKADGSPALALAFALIGLAMFAVGVFA